jgi:WD40 repeat protein
MKLEKPREIILPAGVLGFAAAPDGGRLYAAGMDGQILEIDSASGAKTPFAEKHSSYASGCVLLPDGRTVISAGYDGALLWHDVESKRCIRRVQAHQFWSWQIALAPDGKRLATVTGQYLTGGEKYEPAPATEPTVKIYDTSSGDLLQTFSPLPPVQSVAFSPDGQYVAAGNMMGDVRIWESFSDHLIGQFNTPDFTSWGIIKSANYLGGIFGLAFAPDSQSLLCCGMGPMGDPMAGNGKMTWQRWAWRENPPKMLAQIVDGERGSGLMETLAFHPEGGAFVMAGRQAQGTWNAALFSADDGKLQSSLDTKSRVTRAQFTADGKTLFLAATQAQGFDKGAKKWSEFGRIHVVPVSV